MGGVEQQAGMRRLAQHPCERRIGERGVSSMPATHIRMIACEPNFPYVPVPVTPTCDLIGGASLVEGDGVANGENRWIVS
jgi:hypothetical protein